MDFFKGSAEYDYLKKEIDNAVLDVLKSGTYIMGPEVAKLETSLSNYLNINHSITCSSGSTALLLALDALNLPKGSEIITTPFTFFASASCIHLLGHKIVFADVNYNTFNIDPKLIEATITPKTKAIICVDLFGQRANYKKIKEIADKHDLYIIEDAAQSFGAKIGNETIGQDSDICITSFFPTKNLATIGDGGACFTNNQKFAERMQLMRIHGSKQKYLHESVGYNFRLDSIKAAVLNVKLPFLNEFIEKRRTNAELYNTKINNENIILPKLENDEYYHTYNQYTIKVKNGLRDKLENFLKDNGIPSMIYYPKGLHEQPCFSYLNYPAGKFLITDKLTKEVLSLPVHPLLKKEDLERIVAVIKSISEGK